MNGRRGSPLLGAVVGPMKLAMHAVMYSMLAILTLAAAVDN